MVEKTISERDWRTINERLDAGLCIPFLGAGVNVGGDGLPGLPLGGAVALRLAADLVTADIKQFEDLAKVEVLNDALKDYPQLLRLELQDLARVAFHLERAVDTPHLMQLVRDILTEDECYPSSLLRTLARLPVPMIVTTNYDRLMERALEGVQRPYHLVVQPIAGFHPDELLTVDKEIVAAVAEGKLILYKMHGSFAQNGAGVGAERIIITEEDYIQFLSVVSNDTIGIPPKIREKMATGTLLFLGYSLEDWDFRTLFKGTIEKRERYATFKSFAIQKDPSELWADFWEQKQVVIYDVDLHVFARALAQRYAKHRRQQRAKAHGER